MITGEVGSEGSEGLTVVGELAALPDMLSSVANLATLIAIGFSL